MRARPSGANENGGPVENAGNRPETLSDAQLSGAVAAQGEDAVHVSH
jgi:hypothetical protein